MESNAAVLDADKAVPAVSLAPRPTLASIGVPVRSRFSRVLAGAGRVLMGGFFAVAVAGLVATVVALGEAEGLSGAAMENFSLVSVVAVALAVVSGVCTAVSGRLDDRAAAGVQRVLSDDLWETFGLDVAAGSMPTVVGESVLVLGTRPMVVELVGADVPVVAREWALA